MALDIAQLEAHRSALTGHCYRMLGSAFDAEDAVQETIIRAWKNLERFEGRASLRTWLYRIATNVCLDALAYRTRRARPIEEGPVGTVHDALEAQPDDAGPVRGRRHEPEPNGPHAVEDPRTFRQMNGLIQMREPIYPDVRRSVWRRAVPSTEIVLDLVHGNACRHASARNVRPSMPPRATTRIASAPS